MVEFQHTADGYTFYNRGEVIAEGVFSHGIFVLLENNDTFSEHENAMLAFSFLNKKHYAEMYNRVSKFEFLLSQPAPRTTGLSRLKIHD